MNWKEYQPESIPEDELDKERQKFPFLLQARLDVDPYEEEAESIKDLLPQDFLERFKL